MFNAPGGVAVPYTSYESKTFTISGAVSNYDVKANQVTLFTQTYKEMEIHTDIASTVKLNSASAVGVNLLATEAKKFSNFSMTDAFITTTGDTVIRITGWY